MRNAVLVVMAVAALVAIGPTTACTPEPPEPPEAPEAPEAPSATAPSEAAAARMTALAGEFLRASGVGSADDSAVARLEAATAAGGKGYTITWAAMDEGQRLAAGAFLDGVLSETWAPRVRSVIEVGALLEGERPVTLSITREKRSATVWVWSLVGTDVSLRWAFSAGRVESVGPLVFVARGGRASLLAAHDAAATRLMDALPEKDARRSVWGDAVVGDEMSAPRDMGVSAAEMRDGARAALRELTEMTTGMLRADVASRAGAALASEEVWGRTRLVWRGARLASLEHGHRIAGEGFTITMTMQPPREDRDARARLEWREGE